MDNTDDEALSWAGDDARQRGGGTWSVPQRREGASLSGSRSSSAGDDIRSSSPGDDIRSSSAGEAGVSRRDDGLDTSTQSTTQPTTAEQPSAIVDSVALVATGVFAGIYLLFTVAWLITALRNPIQIADPLGSIMFQLGLWFAVAAGPATFVASLIAGNSRLWVRFLCLVIGAAVLIPWPYFTWAG